VHASIVADVRGHASVESSLPLYTVLLVPMVGNTLSVFCSYSHQDENLRSRLETFIAPLRNEGFIRVWKDRDITAGSDWNAEILENLASADIILLLISADFLTSTYIKSKEIKIAMERHEAGDAIVIPIICRPCDWQSAPFGKLQALPRDGQPIKSGAIREKLLLEVSKGIREVVTRELRRRDA
jgi:hypothetical protein